MFDEYVGVERVPSEALVERHEGRTAEQECVLRTHRAGVLQGSVDDEPSKAMALHAGCDGHPADAHHLCRGVADRDRQSQQASVCHEPVFVSDAEVFFFGSQVKPVEETPKGSSLLPRISSWSALVYWGSRITVSATENRFSDIAT